MAIYHGQATEIVKEARGLLIPGTDVVSRYRDRGFTVDFLASWRLTAWAFRPLAIRWWLQTLAMWDYRMDNREQTYAIELMVQKNQIYGCTQLYAMGSLGILLRSLDKAERLANIWAGKTSATLAGEPETDSMWDLHNYAILAVLILRREL